ncbi:MAG TPA: hypothetical protein VM433_10295 [Mycobacteriales bacterium]|nr:hypothetical protein [Mycobacteriales bacterium]
MVHHSAALATETGQQSLPEAVVAGRFDELSARLQALLEYAVALTVAPREVERSAVQRLREAGFSDRDVIDANQVVAYFNYVNRIAEGLGVELEDDWPQRSRRPRTYTLRQRYSGPPDR